MVDGSFRENVFTAHSLAKQSIGLDDYEVIWVEFYQSAHPDLRDIPNLKIIELGNSDNINYHASTCFNRGIAEASGDLLVVPDADQYVEENFLENCAGVHSRYYKLVVYGYRYNEPDQGVLGDHSWEELKAKCVCNNPRNYGGCLSVRKEWVEAINGYEEHPLFGGSFHANGYNMYIRLSILGLAVEWNKELKLYHPWHPFTLVKDKSYRQQFAFSDWRLKQMDPLAFRGLEPERNKSEDLIPATFLQPEESRAGVKRKKFLGLF